MVLCALFLLGFTVCEVADVLFRNLHRPWLNANEFAWPSVATSTSA